MLHKVRMPVEKKKVIAESVVVSLCKLGLQPSQTETKQLTFPKIPAPKARLEPEL